MKEHFDRSLLYEDPPHTVTTAKIELGLQKELQWLTPLFKLYGNIWLSHSNLSATWWQDGMGGLLVFKKSMGSCIMGNLGFSVGPGLGQKKKSNSVVSPQFLFVLLLNFHLQRTIMGTFKCLCQFLRWYFFHLFTVSSWETAGISFYDWSAPLTALLTKLTLEWAFILYYKVYPGSSPSLTLCYKSCLYTLFRLIKQMIHSNQQSVSHCMIHKQWPEWISSREEPTPKHTVT